MTPVSGLDAHRAATRARLEAANVHRPAGESISWKVNREIVTVAGWGRAILLQLAHPLVAAGVDAHSTFRGSLAASARRLRSTIEVMLMLTFGSDEDAISAAAHINTIHDRVSGVLPRSVGVLPAGQPYSAHDPQLLRWVHATLIDSILLAYERLVGPLTPGERDRYCDEAAVMEPLLGITVGLLPRNTAQLETYLRGMLEGGTIAVSDGSRALARAVLFPPGWWLLWPAFRPLQLITIGWLPAPIRDAYGFRWSNRDARALARWTTALRLVRRILPRFLHDWPASRTSSSHSARSAAPSEWRSEPRS